MPSGPKRRKAAKKKQEKEAAAHHHNHNHNHNGHPPHSADTHPQGDDDLKHHDDKESDAEEVSSPASQENQNNHQSFTDGEKEEVEKAEDASGVRSLSEENKSTEVLTDDSEATQTVVEEEVVLQIKRELEPANELNGKNDIVENLEPQKESGEGVLLQSLDEGTVVEIVSDSKLLDELESKNVTIEHMERLKESSDGGLSLSQDEESHVVDKTNIMVDDAPFGSSAEAVNSLSDGLTQVINAVPVEENYNSIVETGSVVETETVRLSDEKVIGKMIGSSDTSMISNVVVPEMKENVENKVILPHSNGGMPYASVDVTEDKRDEAVVKTDDVVGISDAKVSSSQETEEKFMPSYNAPRADVAHAADSTNGTEHIKDSEVPEVSDRQLLVTPAPRPGQRTSWMSCCGLFEVFGRSDR